jgi:hypothetical protein
MLLVGVLDLALDAMALDGVCEPFKEGLHTCGTGDPSILLMLLFS